MMLTLARQRDCAPSIAPEFALAFDGRIASELRETAVPVHLLGEVRARNPLSVFRARRRLASLLAAERYGAVACHMPWAQAIFGSVVSKARVREIFWMHSPAHRRHWVERWAARTSPDLAICNSRFTAATLPVLFPHTPAEVLYCPVAIPAARRCARERIAVRDEFGAAPDTIVIVQVGRMEALKGHSVLIRTLATLRDRAWVCWQIGDAQRPAEHAYLDRLKRLAEELGLADRIKFFGHRSGVARILEAADIYCQPNIAPDAFGLSFIEALGARLPVVTSALGGALEIVDDTCGVLVPPNDVDALAAALARLIDDAALRRRLGAAGPSRAAALCDPPAILRRMETILRRLETPSHRLN